VCHGIEHAPNIRRRRRNAAVDAYIRLHTHRTGPVEGHLNTPTLAGRFITKHTRRISWLLSLPLWMLIGNDYINTQTYLFTYLTSHQHYHYNKKTTNAAYVQFKPTGKLSQLLYYIPLSYRYLRHASSDLTSSAKALFNHVECKALTDNKYLMQTITKWVHMVTGDSVNMQWKIICITSGVARRSTNVTGCLYEATVNIYWLLDFV